MPFAPGQSGNPSGRPKGAAGLARYVAEQTEGGKELVDRLLAIARSEKTPAREASAAIMALLDRLAGKPLASHEVVAAVHATSALPPGWDALSAEQRRAILDDVERGAVLPTSTALALAAGTDDDDR